jgi:hypothetical protein
MINRLNSILNNKLKLLPPVTTNIVSRDRITSIILVLVMFSHFTFMHTIVHDYVLCYGTDGHIEIENVNELSDCAPHSIFDTQATSSTQLSSNDCKDISFDENCFEEEDYLTQDKTSVNRNIQKNKMFSFQKGNTENFISLNNKNIIENNILENYSNISLLI